MATEALMKERGPWTEGEFPEEIFEGLGPARRAPAGAAKREEGYFIAVDNERIYWQIWSGKEEEPRGIVLLMHGYGEHSSRYDHVATALVRAGYDVMAIDARGHGKSTGQRGFVERFSRYVDDLSEMKRRARDRWPGLPIFILGHSNGGLIALNYALRKPDGVKGFLLSSPLMAVAVEVPAAKEAAGKVMSRLLPAVSLPSGLTGDMVSHLPEVVEAYDRDRLNFDVANARWFTEATAAMERVLERAGDLDQPFYFAVAGADEVVNSKATEAVFHRLGSKDRELEMYRELFHEILNEGEWTSILRRMILWMEARRDGGNEK